MKLYTSHNKFNDLVELADTGRSKTIAVNRRDFKCLLMDHVRFSKELGKLGISIVPGKPVEQEA